MKKYFTYDILSSLGWVFFGIVLGRKYYLEKEFAIFIIMITVSILHLIKLIKVLKNHKINSKHPTKNENHLHRKKLRRTRQRIRQRNS